MKATAPTVTPQPDVMFLLSWASHALQTEMTAALTKLAITPRAHCVLQKSLHGDMTQSQIAESVGLDKTTMVVIVDKLEKEGLARRQPSAVDRRARVIAATEKGRELVARSEEVVSRIHADVLGTLPEEIRGAFVEGLTRLVQGRLSTFVQSETPVRRRSTPI